MIISQQNFDSITLTILDDEIQTESVGSAIKLGVLTFLLTASGVVEGATFKKNVAEYAGGKPQASSLTITKKELGNIVDRSKSKTASVKIGGWEKDKAINVIARTLYMEARGDGLSGENMVMTVIWNRAGGVVDQLVSKCLENKQFSCWNDIGNKTASTYSVSFPKGVFKGGADSVQWNNCVKLATQAVNGTFKPVNTYWNSYYNPDKCSPSWANDLIGAEVVGHHTVGQQKWITNKANKLAAAAKAGKPASAKTYTVKKNDTLWGISKVSGVKIQTLKDLNGLKSDRLQIGQTLKLA